MNDTLTQARQEREKQGQWEVEVSYGGEADLHRHLTGCEKNPGHRKFIPLDKFTEHHLFAFDLNNAASAQNIFVSYTKYNASVRNILDSFTTYITHSDRNLLVSALNIFTSSVQDFFTFYKHYLAYGLNILDSIRGRLDFYPDLLDYFRRRLASDRKLLFSDRKLLFSDRKLLSSDRKLFASDRKLLPSDRDLLASDCKLFSSARDLLFSDRDLFSTDRGFFDFIRRRLDSVHDLLDFINGRLDSDHDLIVTDRYLFDSIRGRIASDIDLLYSIIGHLASNRDLNFSDRGLLDSIRRRLALDRNLLDYSCIHHASTSNRLSTASDLLYSDWDLLPFARERFYSEEVSDTAESYTFSGYCYGNLVPFVRACSDLTVRVSVKYVSEGRPDTFPGNGLPYPSYRGCGEFIRFGTGQVWKVNLHNDKHNSYALCPCKECAQSPTQKTQFAEIFIRTATHVVYDSLEAAQTTCDLFFDRGDTPADCDGVENLIGMSVVMSDVATDVCELRYVTHDLDLASRLEKMVERVDGLEKEDYYRPLIKKNGPNLVLSKVLIVSHPHGCSKQISIGHYIGNDERFGLTYTTATCPGSSWALVIALKKGSFLNWREKFVHSGKCARNINYSALGFLD